jgi:hypothetical protein
MKHALLNILALTALLAINSGAAAATLKYKFSGLFTQDVAGGVAQSSTGGNDIRLPSVTAGDSFHGTLAYSTDQSPMGNDHEASFSLQEFSITFGNNLLQMAVGPFGIYLENNVSGIDRISLAGADDTGYAVLNGEIVRGIASISLVDVDGTALSSVVLSSLPELASFEHKRLQISLTGYFHPSFPSLYDGELGNVSQTPVPAALPLFASALVGGGVISYFKRRRRKLFASRLTNALQIDAHAPRP